MPVRSGSAWQIRIHVLAACLILSTLHPGPSVAREEPPAAHPESAPIERPAPDNAASFPFQDNAASLPAQDNAASVPALDNAACPPALDNAAAPESAPVAQDNAARTGFLDETHDRLERGILRRVIWFDNFFGRRDETEDPRQPDFLIRWRNSVRAEEGGEFKYRSSLLGRFVLPRINKRVRLFISGETESEPQRARLPEDPGQPGFDRTLPNTRLVNLEVRYVMIENPILHLFAGTGVRIDFPVEFFTRTRIRYTLRPGEKYLARFEETLFWKSTDEGFGETTQIELDRQVGEKRVLRWTNSATITQESQGLEWGSELSWFREFSPRSAITFAGGVFGDTEPVTEVETYRILARYRRNVLRPWLFTELEPEISWPRDESFTSEYAFTLRLEVVFQGTAAMTKKRPIAR